MNIGLASANDKQQVINLWAYAFNEQEPFLSWYFNRFWVPENTVIVKENDNLAGSLEMIPYTLDIRGQAVKSSYIVGVGVLPEYRGKGISKLMLKRALEESKNRGEILSMLTPFAYEFYRYMGYELCYSYQYYECKNEDIDNIKSNTSAMRRLSLDDMDKLNDVYQAFMKDKNGYIVRNRKDWEYIFGTLELWDGFLYGLFDQNDNMMGYLSFVKNTERLKIKEMAYLNCSALYDLLGFVSAHFSVYDKVQFDMPIGDNLHYFLKNPRALCAVKPSVMARVINIRQALELIKIDDIRIRIIDDFFAENSGIYEVKQQKVTKTEGMFDCEIDIRTFSQLYTGFLSVKELERLGKLNASTRVLEKLDQAFPKQENYIYHIMTDDF